MSRSNLGLGLLIFAASLPSGCVPLGDHELILQKNQQLQAEIDASTARSASAQAEVDTLRQQLEASDSLAADFQVEVNGLQEQLLIVKTELNQARSALLQLEPLRDENERTTAELATMQQQYEQLTMLNKQLQERISELRQKLPDAAPPIGGEASTETLSVGE